MNEMNFSQAAATLNAVVNQATGTAAIATINNPNDFIAVAQTALKTGYDPIVNAISQVLSKTIFSYRNYKAPLAGLEWDMPRYGNALRKISPVSGSMEDDTAFKWPVAYDSTQTANPLGNGEAVDHYKITKQDSIQTNFYGSAVFKQRYTTFKNQYDVAFSSAEEFGRFVSMQLAERNNDRESYKEGLARSLQANAIASVIAENKTGRVIKVLTEYNAATGLELTATDVMKPENFAPFMRWLYARLQTISRLFSERSELFQTVINSKHVLRHTPAAELRVAMYAPFIDQMQTMVMADTYHDNYLKGVAIEGVSYWQSIQTPGTINMKPVYTTATGALAHPSTATNKANILGIIHDKNAFGYANIDQTAVTTPMNADGLYFNTVHHIRSRAVMDMTEKMAVLVLE